MLNTGSEPHAAIAFWIGVAAFAMALLLVLAIACLRVRLRMRRRNEKLFLALWRPVLLDALSTTGAVSLPALRVRDRLHFLNLWNYMQESLRGVANDRLNEMARRLQCDRTARSLLRTGSRFERLTAILTLGHLRDRESWDELVVQAKMPDSVASVQAARALIKIDPLQATDTMFVAMMTRDDWSVAQLARFLGDAPQAFGLRLSQNLFKLDERHWPRALELADALNLQLPRDSMRFILDTCKTLRTLVAALHIAADPQLLPAVRGHLSHPAWRVRVEVARFLGRVGEPGDISLLGLLLHDKHWWVRYHAGLSLVGMPALGARELARLRVDAAGSLAADMLDHVLAEKDRLGEIRESH